MASTGCCRPRARVATTVLYSLDAQGDDVGLLLACSRIANIDATATGMMKTGRRVLAVLKQDERVVDETLLPAEERKPWGLPW
jgi:hypothetical protein